MTAIEESHEGRWNSLFKPFLLNLKSDIGRAISLSIRYSESVDVTILSEGNTVVPLAKSRYLLTTQTKTEARAEGDDDD